MKAIQLCSLLLVMYVLTACSTGGWLIEDPALQSRSVYLEEAPQMVYELDERFILEELRNELSGGVADSLAHSAMARILEVYSDTDKTDFTLAEHPDEADYVFRVDEVTIRRVRTLNVVHPGPVFRVRVSLSGWQGNEKVFEQSHTLNTNLAVKAAQGARFYIPTPEERDSYQLQRLTIYPTLRSVYGQLWQDIIDDGRRRL